MTAEIPELKTRKPSGKPPWPMILLAGGEKSGKSWSAAAFSASDLVGRTFYVEIGEHYADEYGAIPGARYEIVEHDGSYRDIGRQIWAASRQPRIGGKPNCIVVDSMTLLWDLLSDEAQQTANRRKNKGTDGEAQITMDLWNAAKRRWNDILGVLRTHDGPVILTARLEQVAVMAANGQPTTEKALKVKAEKNLPYEVDVIVRIPAPRQFEITGLRSTRFQLEPGAALPAPDFSVDELLRKLGLAEDGATAPRSVTPLQVAEPEEVAPKREQPTGPREDEWNTPKPPERASQDDVRTLNIRIKQKFGPLTDEQRLDQVRGFIRRPIASTSEVFAPECAAMLKSLAGLADYVKPQPKPEPAPAPVPLKYQQTESPEAIAAAQALLPLVEADQAEALEQRFRDLIESSYDPASLDDALDRAHGAVSDGTLEMDRLKRLMAAGEVKRRDLDAQAKRAQQTRESVAA